VISAVVLAAGLSRRMGKPKLLLKLGGWPVIRQVVTLVQAAGVDDVVVVVGHEKESIREALSGLPVRFAENPTPEAGLAGSIRAGLGALAPATEAVLIALGDQPSLPPDVIPRLVQTYRETSRPVVAPLYQGAQGNPVLFAASVFAELAALSGDRGARSVVEKDPGRVATVPFDLPMPPDLDTPEEYEALKSALARPPS
jgi:molybdenum cofactor cytidylyltransferase